MFTSGFFNSVNSDRRYNAEQMSAIFDGLITDGIFDTIGDHFQVTPGDGLTVSVGTGRAWLNSTWSYNDTAYPIPLSAASPTLARKDLICIKVDKSTAVRANSIVLIEGTPASTPVEPTVTDDATNEIYYHKLAAVTVQAGATAISTADIYNYIGLSTGTPYVTGIVSTTAVDELWSQWDGEFHDWWEYTIKPVINTETVTRLQNNIDHITPKEATMNLYGFSHINPPPAGKTYQEYSTDAILNQISSLLNAVKSPEYESFHIRDATSYEYTNQIGMYFNNSTIAQGYHISVAVSGGEYTLTGAIRQYTFTVINHIENILSSGSGTVDVTAQFWNKVPFESIRGKYVCIFYNNVHSIGDTFTSNTLAYSGISMYVEQNANIERIRVYNVKADNSRGLYFGRPDTSYANGTLVEDIAILDSNFFQKALPKRNPQILLQYTAYITKANGSVTSQYVYFTNAPKDAMPLFIIINAVYTGLNSGYVDNLFLVRTDEFRFSTDYRVPYAGLRRTSGGVAVSSNIAYFYPDSQALEVHLGDYADALVTLIY